MSSPPPKHSLSSPTSGNTPHPVLPTPSSSTSVSIRQNNKASQLKRELEQQLLEKQKQLRESSSGIGKNVLARQVTQLQDRIKELDSGTNNPSSLNDEIQPSSVDRLRSLERDLSSYRSHPLSPGMSSIRNKEKLLNQRTANGLDPLPSPSTSTLLPPTHGHDSTSLLPLPPPPTGSTPTKRRSKIPNTDRRNTDIEFATEIGQGLLLEVRKMQALLQEKEEKLRTLENQKADLERAAEAMAKQMRQREENEEKLKEETWNLELAKQELTISVTELQQNLSKANVEQNKLAKQVNDLRSEIEQLRDREEKLTNTIDNMKQRHEQDMSSIRRHAAAIQREKTDQTKQIEALTSELAIAKAQSRIGKHVSTESEPSIRAGETTDDQAASTLAVKNDTSPSSSPPSSPKQSPARNQAMEVETLKTSLAHAHRMVSNLRSNLHKEKTEKFEFKKLLAESQETIEQLQNDPRMWVDAGPTRSTSGSASNMTLREDGSTPGRRSHKATSGSKRRGGRKGASGRHKLKGTSQNATADDDSVYSYSSMSDQEDSEDVDSFDESDIGFGNNKKKSVGFTPLSSELSQVQMQKSIMVDAEVNTEPTDDFSLPLPALQRSEHRSLGDELESVAAEKDANDKGYVSSMKNIAGGLAAGAAVALGVESLSKSNDTDLSTQRSLEHQIVPSIAIEPREPIQLELASTSAFSIEPEDPSIALAATNAAIAAARLASLQAAVESSTQSEPEDPSIALAAIDAAVSASRARALEAAVDCSIQSDEIVEDPAIAEAAAAATAAAIAAGIAKGIADQRKTAIEAGIDTSVQAEEDPSIAEEAKAAAAAALAAGIAAGIAKNRSEALEAAVDVSVQHEEDPAIAEAEKAARAAVLASGIADGIAKSRSDALLAAVDSSVQYEEDSSIAEAEEAAKAAAIAAGIAAGVAAGIAKIQNEAREAAVDSFVQYEEDPSITEAEEAAKAAAIDAAIASGISAGIAKLQNEAREAAVDSSVQHEEDSSMAEAEEAAKEAAIAAGIAAGVAAAIVKLQNEAREAAVDSSVQCEEDPSVAEAEEAAKAAALDASIAAGVAAEIAKLQNEAREAAVDCSVQHEEDPSIIEAEEAAKDAAIAAAVAAGIAAGITKHQNEVREAAVDSSVQYEEDPSIVEAEEATKAAAIAAGIAAGVAAGIAKLQDEAREAAVDSSVQYEEDPSIAEAEEAARAAAIASAIAEGVQKSRSDALEAAVDSSVQYEEDLSIAEAEEAAKAAAIAAGIAAGIAKLQDEAHEAAIHTSVQHEEDPSIAEAEEAAKAAAIASGIAEGLLKSRSDALEAAVDSSVQSEAEDPSVAAAALADAINAARATSLQNSIDASVQYEEPEGSSASKVAGLAGAAALTAAALAATSRGITHPKSSSTSDQEAQVYNNAGVDSNERNIPAFVDNARSVQSKDANSQQLRGIANSPLSSEGMSGPQYTDVQHEVQSTEVGKKDGDMKTNRDIAAVIATPSGSSRTISDSEDEFFDAQSKPSSRRTINSFNNVKPNSRNSHLNEEITPTHDYDSSASAGANPRFVSSEEPKESNDEKIFSKTETDALIAAAVAAALAAAISSNNAHENKSDRDTSNMNDNRGLDSAVVSTSPLSAGTPSTEDEDDYGNEDYGNVVVHLPREEDTITSLPVDHIAERKRDYVPITSSDVFSTDMFEENNPAVIEAPEQARPELTKGPTVVLFDQEPEERELSEADVPQRPSNPPPEALLSRASLSPAFANNRSMSSGSSRSKGKAPLEYSDLESSPAPSNEDLYRAALLQQQQQHHNKRGSISASSISTNNTNEQLHSIHSSQNDAVTRTSATTDPAMINLITQTMIGDWMYKYTRKAVGGGLSENRHQRYFWIHPYTRTLYWSTNAPGVDGNEAKAKSALIENITTVPDYSTSVDGVPNVSLLIQTSNRPLKLTAPTMEKHELWFEAISHLLARNRNSNGLTLLNDTKKADNTNARSVSSGTTGSLLNRPSFRRLHDIFQHPSSSTSVETSDDHIELDDDDEALEDVRMCCNGKHHVSKLEKDHTHRQQYRKRKSRPAVATIG